MSFSETIRWGFSFVLVCALGVACGSEEPAEDQNAAQSCVANQTQSCMCDNGLPGISTCTANGTYSPCDCSSSTQGQDPPPAADNCVTGQTQACVCLDGTPGTSVCVNGQAFSECQCDSPPPAPPAAGADAPGAGGTAGPGVAVDAGATAGAAGTAGAGGISAPIDAGTQDGGGTGGSTGGADSGTTGTPPTPIGPEDGDPNGPIVSITEVACGGPTNPFGLGSANHQMDGRDMIVTYPCNKHAGAPVSFILNLHGTTPLEQHFYQHGYFSVHQFAESHNFIVVTPSSVVTQWGNGDNGEDEPHLMNIIDWVYASFSGPDKFDIRAMWVGGHSWGGMYTARFGCNAAIADKVKGLIMMSGGGVGGFMGASCANNVSAIITTAEGDGREPGDQTAVATGHGCGAAQTEQILNNNHTFWPDCDPGFVHANYYMLGKEHASFMDREVVESIADWIKLARQ